MRKIEVVVCDDHEIFREGLKSTFAADTAIEIVAEAADGLECIAVVDKHQPDIVLLDINLPQMDGLECCKHILEHHPNTKVIALTEFHENRLIKQMMKNGAAAYILKIKGKKEIRKGILDVFKGNGQVPHKDDLHEQNSSRKLFANLSKREKEVLDQLCKGKSSKEIAKELYISVYTVNNHKAKIFQKTGQHNATGLVLWAMENEIFKVS